jgi:branched-chain amino acid transport system substrate-binding protein
MRRIALVAMAGALAGPVAVGLGGAASVEPLPQSFCSPVVRGTTEPQYLIVSDLPVRGSDARAFTLSMQRAIRFMVERRGFKAGKYSIGYQGCDDSSPQGPPGALGKCASNAKAYAADPSVIGVVGTWFSGCSAVEIPILDKAPNGPLAMISPSNTNVGLTHAGAGTDPGEPGRYYPTGRRNFVRVISPDDAQGVADAVLAKRLGLRSVFVLDDNEQYGLTVAGPFRKAAKALGLRIAGTGSWNVNQTTFDALARKVARSGAGGLFLGGFACQGCAALIRDLRTALGPSAPIIAPDGWSDIKGLVKAAGVKATEGLYVSVPGVPTSKLGPLGRQIARKFGLTAPGSGGPPYAAQAVAVLLDAIASSDGTRASVTEHLLGAHVHGGILGDFNFDKNGDPTYNPVTVFRIHRGIGTINRVVAPPTDLIG